MFEMFTGIVSAPSGTLAGRIADQLADALKKEGEPVILMKNVVKGVHLESVPGKKWSLKFRSDAAGTIILPIGAEMECSDAQTKQMVSSMVAMLRRGWGWKKDKKTGQFFAPWGQQEKLKDKPQHHSAYRRQILTHVIH